MAAAQSLNISVPTTWARPKRMDPGKGEAGGQSATWQAVHVCHEDGWGAATWRPRVGHHPPCHADNKWRGEKVVRGTETRLITNQMWQNVAERGKMLYDIARYGSNCGVNRRVCGKTVLSPSPSNFDPPPPVEEVGGRKQTEWGTKCCHLAALP